MSDVRIPFAIRKSDHKFVEVSDVERELKGIYLKGLKRSVPFPLSAP